MDFESFVKDIEKNSLNVYGVEVYEDGILTHSYGDSNENLYDIYSATKSILSIAVGIAVDEKKFDINRSILDYLPEKKTLGLSAQKRSVFEQITVKRLLTMSVAGFPFRPEGDSYIDSALNADIASPDKKEFNYSNISAYLVGVALSEAL